MLGVSCVTATIVFNRYIYVVVVSKKYFYHASC